MLQAARFATPALSTQTNLIHARARLPLVDAFRAVVATLVVWHHFALYGPLCDWAKPDLGPFLEALKGHRSAVQVFFIVSGYVLARSMSPRTWNARHASWFMVRRYCRLGLPYLATIALAIGACALGRGRLPEDVVGAPVTTEQLLAHVFFLQDILGYPSLSAGLWFVCIEFQLGILYVLILLARDVLARFARREPGEQMTAVAMALGWPLAGASLFYFNAHDRFGAWGSYFFGQFFLGVMVYHALADRRWTIPFAVYTLMVAAALAYAWRWRLATSLATGLVLYAAGKRGLIDRWPASRIVAYLGQTSYSLFLVHFSALVIVATIWTAAGWSSRHEAAAGLVVAYGASLALAHAFYQFVEVPSARLSRRFS